MIIIMFRLSVVSFIYVIFVTSCFATDSQNVAKNVAKNVVKNDIKNVVMTMIEDRSCGIRFWLKPMSQFFILGHINAWISVWKTPNIADKNIVMMFI